jgi:hypothetical protein
LVFFLISTSCYAGFVEEICLRVATRAANIKHFENIKIEKSPNGKGRVYRQYQKYALNPDFQRMVAKSYPVALLIKLFPGSRIDDESGPTRFLPSGDALEEARKKWNKTHTHEDSLPVGFYESSGKNTDVPDKILLDRWIDDGMIPIANVTFRNAYFSFNQQQVRRSFFLPVELTNRHRGAGKSIRHALELAPPTERAALEEIYNEYLETLRTLVDLSVGSLPVYRAIEQSLAKFEADHPRSPVLNYIESAIQSLDMSVPELRGLFQQRVDAFSRQGVSTEFDRAHFGSYQ